MLESFFFTFLAEESSEILKKWIELFVHQHIQISFDLFSKWQYPQYPYGYPHYPDGHPRYPDNYLDYPKRYEKPEPPTGGFSHLFFECPPFFPFPIWKKPFWLVWHRTAACTACSRNIAPNSDRESCFRRGSPREHLMIEGFWPPRTTARKKKTLHNTHTGFVLLRSI